MQEESSLYLLRLVDCRLLWIFQREEAPFLLIKHDINANTSLKYLNEIYEAR